MFKKIAIVLYLLMAVNVSANDFLDWDYWQTASVQDVKDKIASGVDINARGEYGFTALMAAAYNSQNPEIITTLLEAEANAGAKDNEGKTAYDYILENKDLKKSEARWKLHDLRFK